MDLSYIPNRYAEKYEKEKQGIKFIKGRSVLDYVHIFKGETPQQALENTKEILALADFSDYKRYWFTEHHNATTIFSIAPDLLMMLAGTLTKSMNLGAGGIMLPNYSPYKVAENFALLEAAFSNRLDLGMARASGKDFLANTLIERKAAYLRRNVVYNKFRAALS